MPTRILTKTSKYIRIFLLILDFLVLNFSFVISIFIIYNNYSVTSNKSIYSLVIFSNLIWVLLIGVYRANQVMRVEPMEKIISRSIKMILSHIAILYILVFTLEFNGIIKLFVLIFSVIFIFSNTFLKLIALFSLKQMRRKGINNKNVVIIGVNKNGLELERVLKKEISFGYKVLGFFKVDLDFNTSQVKLLGHIDEIKDFISKNNVDEVYYTASNYDEKRLKDLIIFCEKNFIRFKFIPSFKELTSNRKFVIDFYESIPVIIFRKEPLENLFNKSIKRIFDIFMSLFVILCIMPWLFPIVFIFQKLTSKGPIFFIQLRSGQDNRVFKCLKFRTMRVNELSDKIGTQDNDPRITKFGKVLRKTRIDELPQFFNVLIGQMSVVGPRPHMLSHTEEYSKLIEEFLVRHYVKPGITGWAQATGYIDESRKLQEMQDKVKNDIYYIENWSFLLDLKIIFLTVFNAIKGDKNAK